MIYSEVIKIIGNAQTNFKLIPIEVASGSPQGLCQSLFSFVC